MRFFAYFRWGPNERSEHKSPLCGTFGGSFCEAKDPERSERVRRAPPCERIQFEPHRLHILEKTQSAGLRFFAYFRWGPNERSEHKSPLCGTFGGSFCEAKDPERSERVRRAPPCERIQFEPHRLHILEKRNPQGCVFLHIPDGVRTNEANTKVRSAELLGRQQSQWVLAQ